ncbi:hypothetical protein H0H87_001014, partial [Tephrocybe sp. NHM501043]
LSDLAKKSISCPISSLAHSNVFNSQPVTPALVNSDSLLQSILVLNPITPPGWTPPDNSLYNDDSDNE